MKERIGILVSLLLLVLLGVFGFHLLVQREDSDDGRSTAVERGSSALPTPELLPDSGPAAGGAVATLVHFERSVKSKRADELVWEHAQEEMSLYGNDAVRTFERSSANILFGRGDVIEVDENTLIVIVPRETRNEDEISLALLSPSLLQRIADQPVEKQEQMLQEAMTAREVRVVKIASDAGGEDVRIGVKTLSDESNAIVSHGGTVKVIGPDGTEITLDANMATALGPAGLFSAPRALPQAPRLSAPQDGAVYAFQRKAPRVKLTWEPVSEADSYRIVVARDSEFNNVFAEETLRKTSLVAYNVEPGNYYWRVKAQNPEGIEGPFSKARMIRATQDDTPPELTIAFPPDMFISPGPEVEIRGKTDLGVRVRINGNSVPVTSDGNFVHKLELAEGTALITVEAIDSAGNVGYGKRIVTYRGKRSSVAVLSEKP